MPRFSCGFGHVPRDKSLKHKQLERFSTDFKVSFSCGFGISQSCTICSSKISALYQVTSKTNDEIWQARKKYCQKSCFCLDEARQKYACFFFTIIHQVKPYVTHNFCRWNKKILGSGERYGKITHLAKNNQKLYLNWESVLSAACSQF